MRDCKLHLERLCVQLFWAIARRATILCRGLTLFLLFVLLYLVLVLALAQCLPDLRPLKFGLVG